VTTATTRDDRIEAHIPLVRALARRYARRGGEPFDDLVQVGCIGLIHAVDRYDPARGAFEAYAVPTITGEIRRHLRDRAPLVRAPASLPRAAVGPLTDDVPCPTDPIPAVDARLAVVDALRTLPLHERRIVVLWLYGGRSQRRIAAEVGISQIHVSRLLRGALARLQVTLGEPARLPGPDAGRRFDT